MNSPFLAYSEGPKFVFNVLGGFRPFSSLVGVTDVVADISQTDALPEGLFSAAAQQPRRVDVVVGVGQRRQRAADLEARHHRQDHRKLLAGAVRLRVVQKVSGFAKSLAKTFCASSNLVF